jgi:integrase
VAFNNAMAYAVERGWLSVAPRLKKLKEKEPVKRTLLSAGDIKRLLKACVPKVTKNAQELGFHIRFLFLTGAREQEALKSAVAGCGPLESAGDYRSRWRHQNRKA